MDTGYSYGRFSNLEQAAGDSLRRQRERAQAWAEKNGVRIDETLTDKGVSAYRGLNRTAGALSRFIELVDKGEIKRGSYLILESLDRMSRENIRQILPDFIRLINAGIRLVTLIDEQIYSAERLDREPFALFGSLMVLMRAHEESKTKSDRLSAVWQQKRAHSEAAVMTSRVPAWLSVVTMDGQRRIVENQDRVKIVKRIIAETIHGHGRRTIARRLNSEGVLSWGPEKKGRRKGWQPSYVKKLVESRALLGEMQPYSRGEDGKRRAAGPALQGYYPAIIDETTFLRANAAKAQRSNMAGPAGEGVSNLLRGLARCGCGASMTRLNKGPKPRGGAFLVCSDAHRLIECDNDRYWRLDQAETAVLRGTARLNVGAVLRKDQDEQPTRTLRDVEAEIADVTMRRERYYMLVEGGDDDALQPALTLAARLKRLRAEASEMRKDARFAAASPTQAERRVYLRELMQALTDADREKRTELRTRISQELRATLTEVRFWPQAIEVVYPAVKGRTWGPGSAPTAVQVFTDDAGEIAFFMTLTDPEENMRSDTLVRTWLAARSPGPHRTLRAA